MQEAQLQEPSATGSEPLSWAVQEARARFVAANPQSQARHAEACAVLPGGNTRSVLFHSPFPLTVARGEGCLLWDVDGHRYIDFLGEYTAGLFGHSHPVIRAAIDRALDDGISLGAHSAAEAQLAAAICARFPSLERVRFTNSGTEANLLALTAARAFTGRQQVLVFDGAYHGGVLTFAGGGSPVNVPFPYIIAPYNDHARTAALLEAHGPDLAAILVEPMLGAGGCIPADPSFLQLLRDAATAQGCVLIFDEVMTSRLAPGGLQEALGVQPDMTTLGKYLGGGLSFGAFGGQAAIMEQFNPHHPQALPHAGTFNNNVLTMAAGLAALTQVYTPEAARVLNARGDELRTQLNALCQQQHAPLQWTGRGSMLTMHTTARPLHAPADLAAADQELKELFFFDMLAQGIWLARRGMVTLSLPIGAGECAALLAAVEQFLHTRQNCFAPVVTAG